MNLSVKYLRKSGLILLLGLIIYFPLFLHLTSGPLQTYDESRLGINAYEMLKSGNVIVTRYEGSPDMWNTKPPLMIWLQALAMKIFGVNELAVRLPSALAALATCLLFLWFSKKKFGRYTLGFIAVLVLITSNGYVTEHTTRTGDYDSLLALLTTAALFSFFCYTEAGKEERGRWLLIFFVSLTLAALCKGIQALLFLPAIGIYLLLQNQVVRMLREKSFYPGVLLFIIFVAGYYLLRQQLNPGYWNAVMQNELGGRFLNTIEQHKSPFAYYFTEIVDSGFSPWYLLIPCGWIVGWSSLNATMRRMTLFIVLCTITYLLIISSAQTKLSWYTAPIYPLMALSVAIFICWIFELLNSSQFFSSQLTKPVAGYLMLFLIFVIPYSKIVSKVYDLKIPDWDQYSYDIPIFLKHAAEDNINLDKSKVVVNFWPSSILFYKNEFAERNQQITVANFNELYEGDRVIISQDNLYDELVRNFDVSIINVYNKVRIVHLDHKK